MGNACLGYPNKGIREEMEQRHNRKTLIVNLDWRPETSKAAYLKINGQDEEYDTPIEITPNIPLSIWVECRSGGDRFTRFSFEPEDTNHQEYIYETLYTPTDTEIISARFDPYWT